MVAVSGYDIHVCNVTALGNMRAIPFLTKFDAMFNKRSLSFNYSGARFGKGSSNTGIEGFHKLSNGTTSDLDLRNRFQKHVVPLTKKK
jgi:hypothetical protein